MTEWGLILIPYPSLSVSIFSSIYVIITASIGAWFSTSYHQSKGNFLHLIINSKVEEIVRIAGERGILSVLDMHQDVFNRFKYYLNYMDMHQDVFNRFKYHLNFYFKYGHASRCLHLQFEFYSKLSKDASRCLQQVWCNQVEGLGSPAYRMNIQNYSPGSTVATGSPTGQPTLRRKTSHILLRLSSLFSPNFQF